MANSEPPYAIPAVGFQSRKAAQVCAFFAVKAGGTIEKLKLIKLVYLAEREFLAKHRHPMLFDELHSLPHGPICSSTLNGIDGVIHEDTWSEFLARNGNVVVALKRFARDDLDEISDAEIETIDEVWQAHGGKTSSQLRNYSHDHCGEYTETARGRIPISYRDVLEALGDPEAASVEKEIADMRRAESMLLG
jgi:uncharacterized phage-associated protein